ncbi:tetratricopeptide repeat protein [Horticoccus luteus]|uniref:Tetratricopeptide repeat protein n=1 Tax=Horticoccus luteus TaxID=2862869 RepID=A0A8F9XGL6_9BACT|nr:tetratricopeptide repeat protein [Horticoccus luteus]QYM79357.1 tetratricopeptide repeat protein [Horticoccus luteus]
MTGGGRAVAAHPPSNNVLAEAWVDMADNRAKDAFILLKAKPPAGDRERELARATAMIDNQPVTDGQLQQAEAVFVRLAGGDDEAAQIAAYLRARLYHVHFSTSDLARASELYRAVAARWPDGHWGQLALVKAGLIQLYATEKIPDARARVREVAKLLERIREPGLRRDLQFQMGRAGTFFELTPDEVLPYFEAADKIGGLGVLTQQDLTAELGELSFRAKRWTEARRYFERYIAQYPDARKFAVEQKLRVIDAQLAAGKEAR